MRKIFFFLLLLSLSHSQDLFSQDTSNIEVYLVTCNPGTETYSIYGHSALRIVTPEVSDLVYNWGIFDFSTPNFAWKFAKGRLDYLLGAYPFTRFLEDYKMEQRSVFIQKINLEPLEIKLLLSFIAENMKPENRRYRYDFFYDDCSTRIRDLLEKSITNRLTYKPYLESELPTFRQKVREYQKPYPWLNLGIDLIMGLSSDKKASPRDQMFLPLDLMRELSDARVNRDGKMIPLLQNPQTILQFELPEIRRNIITSPIVVFGVLLILTIMFSAGIKNKRSNDFFDIILFTIYSILALLMIFFNFFTDHDQMKWNLNIIWLNPIILFCLYSLILKKDWQLPFRIVFYLAVIVILPLLIFYQVYNNDLVPLVLILALRSSIRSGFNWNPFEIDGVLSD